MAIRSFADQTTTDIYHGHNTKDARRTSQEIWQVARRKLALLQNARSLQDLDMPGLQTKPLKYDRPGFVSVRVNLIFRIIFRFENGDAYEVSIENFHGKNQS